MSSTHYADIFDAALSVEETAAAAGRAAGQAAGAEEGAQEGTAMGLQRGRKLAAEMSFYHACCARWLELQQQEAQTPGAAPLLAVVPPKCLASMAALLELTAAVPRVNDRSADLAVAAQTCRAKFKAITAMLHATDVRFDPAQQTAAKDMSF